MGSRVLLLLKLALLAAYSTLAVVAPAPAPDCDRKCGNVDIPYPFGLKEGCFKDHDFQIICNSSSGHPVPYLARERNDIVKDHNIQVLDISENTSEVHVSMPVFDICYDPKGPYNMWRHGFSVPSKFGISNKKNKFIVVGYDTYAFLYDRKEQRLNGCDSRCGNQTSSLLRTNNEKGSCSGTGSCHSDLEQAVSNYTITLVFYYSSDVPDQARCSFAFVAQKGSFNSSYDDDLKKMKRSNRSTVVLDWAVDNTTSCGGACKSSNTECRESESVGGHYYCKCKQGFQGNPYRDDGCKERCRWIGGFSSSLKNSTILFFSVHPELEVSEQGQTSDSENG